MTDFNDLVKQLRLQNEEPTVGWYTRKLLADAADAITELSKDVRRQMDFVNQGAEQISRMHRIIKDQEMTIKDIRSQLDSVRRREPVVGIDGPRVIGL